MPIWLIDFFRFILVYLPAILLAVPVMVWAYLELKTDRAWSHLFVVVSSLALAIALVMVAANFPVSTQYIWSGARLAPAIAWVKGYDLYYPVDRGPVLVQMYGPVSAFVYVPTALMAHPTTAILLGACINLLLYFLPALWFVACCRRRQSWPVLFAAMVGFILISSRQFVLAATATLVTIDAPALGLAACGMALLARGEVGKSWRLGFQCGTFAALCAWTKLTFAPVGVAMAVYVLMTARPRDALRFIAALAIAGGVVTGVFIAWFGPELLVQNIVVPSKQSWEWPQLTPPAALLRGVYYMWKDAWPLDWIVLVAVILGMIGPWPRAATFRDWVKANPWLLPLLAAILVFPTSLLARVKIGGIWNNVSASGYFALLAAVCALMSRAETGNEPLPAANRVARVALLTLLAFGCWIDRESIGKTADGLAMWSHLDENDHERFYRLTAEHPGEVYVPNFPLSSLMSEGRLYHFSAGVDSLAWAGYPMSEEHFRAWLPQKLKAILVFRYATPPFLMERFPDFDQDANVPSIPLWKAMTRDGHFP